MRYDKKQTLDTFVFQIGNAGEYLIPLSKIDCNDKNDRGNNKFLQSNEIKLANSKFKIRDFTTYCQQFHVNGNNRY